MAAINGVQSTGTPKAYWERTFRRLLKTVGFEKATECVF